MAGVTAAASELNVRRPRFGLGRLRSRRKVELVMLLPAVAVAVVLGGYPIIAGIWIGFTNERVGGVFGFVKTRFVGFANFTSIWDDPAFRTGLVLILEIALAVVFTTYVLAYLQASLLNLEFPFRRVVRTIVLLPMAIPAVVVGELFGYLYDPSVGPINGVLKHLRILKTPEFLANAGFRWMWIAIPAVWMALPFATLFLLASMQGIPKDQLEAATVDGAGWLRRFWHVTFPGTRGSLAAIVPLSFAAQLLAFEMYVALFGQGGGVTNVASSGLLIPSVYAYYNLSNGLMGRAAATGDLILVVIVIAFLASRYISLREERHR
jgi:multiple sugar transport system permease protein